MTHVARTEKLSSAEAAAHIEYKTTRNEATRCYFCKNKCLRTFIDVKTNIVNIDYKPPVKTKVPLEAGAQRLIIATCEKGTVENIDEMRGIKGNLDKIKKENPNFVEIAAKGVFRVQDVPLVADAPPKFQITAAQKKRAALLPIPGEREEEFGPRRMKPEHLKRAAKKPKGYTKAIRSTRSSDRLKRSA